MAWHMILKAPYLNNHTHAVKKLERTVNSFSILAAPNKLQMCNKLYLHLPSISFSKLCYCYF